MEILMPRMLLMPVLAGSVLLALGLPAPASAQTTDAVSAASPYAMGASPEQSAMLERWRTELGLSIEQQAIIGEIVADYGARLQPLFQRGAETVWSVLNVAPKDPEYTLDTEQAAQAAAETAAQIVRQVSQLRSAVHSVLTQAQIDTLDRLIEEQRVELAKKKAELEARKADESAETQPQ
jgi:hypothetical protein